MVALCTKQRTHHVFLPPVGGCIQHKAGGEPFVVIASAGGYHGICSCCEEDDMVAPGRWEGGRGAAWGGWVDLGGGEVREVAVLSSSEKQESQLRARSDRRRDQNIYKAFC